MWNGFHSVPEDDTTQPSLLRGDAIVTELHHKASWQVEMNARRFYELIADVERKSKCVDDTIMWDNELEGHW